MSRADSMSRRVRHRLMDPKPIAEQVMVIFGASSGIGRATALQALPRGARLVVAGRDGDALASLAEHGTPDQIAIVTADAANVSDVEHVAQVAGSRYGRIDTWAHVAGIGLWGRLQEITPEEFQRVIDVDLLGPVYGAMAALPFLRRQGGAYIVVSSETARRALPLMSAYSAAKHGVDGFAESLRAELEHDKIPVSVTQIMPG